jgi:membrane protein implicated in regulation of membrane protease activity
VATEEKSVAGHSCKSGLPDLDGSRTMKKILGAALLLAEIMASVWAVDLAFSLISDPSTWLLIAGIWLLFLVGAFWYYRLLVMKHRREERQKKGGDDASDSNESSTFGKLEHFVSDVSGSVGRRVRNANWPGKRGDQG